MKKNLVAVGLGLILTLTAFADSIDGNARAQQHFSKTFTGAENVSWKKVGNYTEVKFTWGGQVMEAFYSTDDGQYVATARVINFTELPVSVINSIKETYSGYTVTEVAEIERKDEGVAYYVSVENEKKKLILKANGSGGLDIFKKEKIK